jgi:hypothetical protein
MLLNYRNTHGSRLLTQVTGTLKETLLLLILLIFPSSTPLSLSSNSNSNAKIFPLLHHFLSSQGIVASLSLLSISRKRKQTPLPEPDSGPTHDKEDPQLRHRLGLTRIPDSFKNCFRMTSSTFEWLSGLLEPLLECRDPAGSPLNLYDERRLGIGLFRLATGADYPEISKQLGISESVAKFCTKQLCRVLCTDFRFWVRQKEDNPYS